MTESFLADAKHSVLVENTGQTVLKTLKALEDRRSLVLARWIWELLQNARDAAENNGVAVSVAVEPRLLRFAHDGRPFRVKEVAHLVYHGSTKQQDPETIGQYGTGFLSTHLLSARVRVRGMLADDGRPFDFVLSREGSSASELSERMDSSWTEFERSLGRCDMPGEPNSTVFEYELGNHNTVDAVRAGIESLELCAPYILADNPRMRSISVVREDATRRFAVSTGSSSPALVHVTDTFNGNAEQFAVALSANRDAHVAALLQRNGQQMRVAITTRTPRLFLAFPLIGTEDFPFPAVINSEHFSPNEERDGIPLGTGDTPANRENKALIVAASEALMLLIRRGIEESWESLSVLALFPPVVPKTWVNSEWLTEQQKSLVRLVLEQPIVRTQAGAHVAPTRAWIPAGRGKDAIWRLTALIAESAERLPQEKYAETWALCVRSWSDACGLDLENTPGSWTLRKLAAWTAQADTLAALQDRLGSDARALSWLNDLLEMIIAQEDTGLLDEFPLLVNQDETFQVRSNIKRDPGIDTELKEICRDLGAPVTGGLLHRELAAGVYARLLDEESQDRVLSHALARLKEQSDAARTQVYVNANVSLFSWLFQREMYEPLDGYPALTAENEGIAKLNPEADLDDWPLGPVAVWPTYIQPYSDLYPDRKVLSSLYMGRCGNMEAWLRAGTELGVHASPIYQLEAVVDRFVPDEPLPTDSSQTHESTALELRTRIAYLTGETGILNSSRKSISKATSLLQMIVAIISNEQTRHLEAVVAGCACGQSHRFFPADWITPLRDNKWIPLGAGRSETANADSIARIVHHVSKSAELLQDRAFALLAAALGISLADVTLRSIANSEQERALFVQAFAAIVKATNGDPARVTALADELQHHPELIEELEEKRRTRGRVAANKTLGEAVERALKKKLESLGLTVTRTGVGSDYEIETDILENGEEIWFRLHGGGESLLLEVKATRTNFVRMTRCQAETAVAAPHRFALCVVELEADDVDDDSVAGARFVIDIGDRIEPVQRALTELEGIQEAAALRNSGIEVILTDSQVRFCVSARVWRDELDLNLFVAHVVASFRP
jgi:hypothetical protein